MIFSAQGLFNQQNASSSGVFQEGSNPENSDRSVFSSGGNGNSDFLSLLINSAGGKAGQDTGESDSVRGIAGLLKESENPDGLVRLLALWSEESGAVRQDFEDTDFSDAAEALADALRIMESEENSGRDAAGMEKLLEGLGLGALKEIVREASNSAASGKDTEIPREGIFARNRGRQQDARGREMDAAGRLSNEQVGRDGSGRQNGDLQEALQKAEKYLRNLNRSENSRDSAEKSGSGANGRENAGQGMKGFFEALEESFSPRGGKSAEAMPTGLDKFFGKREKAGLDENTSLIERALEGEVKDSRKIGGKTADAIMSALRQADGNTGDKGKGGSAAGGMLNQVQADTAGRYSLGSNEGARTVFETADQAGIAQGGGEKAASQAASSRPSGASFETQLQNAENRVVNQVSFKLGVGMRQGSGRMTINMHPPELGSVKVRINSERGSLNVHLQSQTQQVAGILERNLPALQQSLANQGIEVTDMQVSVDSGKGDEAGQFEDGGQGFAGGKSNPDRRSGSEDEQSGMQQQDPSSASVGEYGQGLSLRV